MAKFNVGDKLVLAPIYMDGWFRHGSTDYPNALTVILVDDTMQWYTMKSANQALTYTYTYKYADDAYRLANPDEVENLF